MSGPLRDQHLNAIEALVALEELQMTKTEALAWADMPFAQRLATTLSGRDYDSRMEACVVALAAEVRAYDRHDHCLSDCPCDPQPVGRCEDPSE